MNEVKDIKDSALNALKERFSSPLYGYIIISWLLLNWKSVYTTLFVSNESIITKYGLLKNEYIMQAVEGNGLLNIIFPILATAFFVWIMPFATRFVYDKVSKDKFKIEEIDEKNHQEYLDTKKMTVQKEIDLNKVEQTLGQQDPKLLWKKEFYDFTSTNMYPKFQQLINCIYNVRGPGYVLSSTNPVAQEVLVFGHSNDLIKYKDGSNNTIEFTEKGKYFVSLYSSRNNN